MYCPPVQILWTTLRWFSCLPLFGLLDNLVKADFPKILGLVPSNEEGQYTGFKCISQKSTNKSGVQICLDGTLPIFICMSVDDTV